MLLDLQTFCFILFSLSLSLSLSLSSCIGDCDIFTSLSLENTQCIIVRNFWRSLLLVIHQQVTWHAESWPECWIYRYCEFMLFCNCTYKSLPLGLLSIDVFLSRRNSCCRSLLCSWYQEVCSHESNTNQNLVTASGSWCRIFNIDHLILYFFI